jgi:hypothetical protein
MARDHQHNWKPFHEVYKGPLRANRASPLPAKESSLHKRVEWAGWLNSYKAWLVDSVEPLSFSLAWPHSTMRHGLVCW